ncbi:hypothetical protein [Marinitoga sp. 1155]|uniref:hypothetical protein n=1 Tax=Marinitoga sp. 1155 TaxID=1428448 RepID=UPI000640C682|nr:hypothetical protein [Marinitoga sp. 1155]KLO22369.1 hypothetical protein X274_08410 [Marinitoga sp. 1155]
MKKKYIFFIVIPLILLVLIFKPIKVVLNLNTPFENMTYTLKIDNKTYDISKDIWMFPGKHKIEINLSKNILKKEIKVPYFSFSKQYYNIVLKEPIINVSYERKDYNKILLYLNSKNYILDYWKISYNDREYQTTLSTYNIFISPYVNTSLKVKGYIQNKKIYEKIFDIKAPLSEIIDYNIKIDNYINLSFELNNKMINPIKYDIYKNGEFIETIKNNSYKDKFTYDVVKYEIIPIYPSGYRGKKYKIIKPALPEIPDEISKKELNLNYDEITLNGKKYSKENFVEGKNALIIKINKNITWYKTITLDTTPPKIEKVTLKYNGKYKISIISDERAKFELITKENTYTFESDEFEFKSTGKDATLLAYDELSNRTKPFIINLNPFPEYRINVQNNLISFKFKKNNISEYCELKILDEENNLITRIDIKKLNDFTFSNLSPGKEYKFILYIDNTFKKTIYTKITKPPGLQIKKFENIKIGTFYIELLNDYKYNYYSIELEDYSKTGNFSGNFFNLEIPLEKLTSEGTLTLWREFKNLKTKKIKLKLKDNFLYKKKIYKKLPDILKEEDAPYIVSEDQNFKNIKIKGRVEILMFPDKKIVVNGIVFNDKSSKLIIKPIKESFKGIELNSGILKNTEIYNAYTGITINKKFDLYNLIIKNCKTGIYGKDATGTAYNILLYDNNIGVNLIKSSVEIKNSLFFDNATAFSFYDSDIYLYNLSIADSKLDIDLYSSNLKIKSSDFLNSINSIKSNLSNIYIISSTFRNNNKTIKSLKDEKLKIEKSRFINNNISLDIFETPFNIYLSSFLNNEVAVKVFNPNSNKKINIEKFTIENSTFKNNKMDIYIAGSNNIYLKNTYIKNYLDGTISPTWVDERGKILNRGIIISGGAK